MNQGGWVNLRFHLLVSGVNQVEWEREVNLRFLFFTSGVWKKSRKHCSVNFCSLAVFQSSGHEGWWGAAGPYLGPAEMASFSSRDFSRSNKYDTLWHVVSTGYFYVLFSWAIADSHFHPLEIYKNTSLSFTTITFTVNSHADNHFYK